MAKRKKKAAKSRTARKRRPPLRRRTTRKRHTAKRRTSAKQRTGAERRTTAKRQRPAATRRLPRKRVRDKEQEVFVDQALTQSIETEKPLIPKMRTTNKRMACHGRAGCNH
jgi:hypothetical protein